MYAIWLVFLLLSIIFIAKRCILYDSFTHKAEIKCYEQAYNDA